VVHPLGELDRPAARSEDDADPPACLEAGERGSVQTRVFHGLARRGERHRDGARDVADVLRFDVVGRDEPLDLTGDRGGKALGVEERDASDAALPLSQRAGERLAAVPVGGHASDARDRDPALHRP
jgi:hypothetical protein